MKNSIFLLAILYSSITFSQITYSQEQRQAILDVTKKELYIGAIGLKEPYPIASSFAIITEQRDINSNGVDVYFDFGQESGFFDIDYIIDENGNKFQIFSVVDALNYMKKLGWEYIDSKGFYFTKFYLTKYMFENKGKGIVPVIKE